MCRRQAHPNAGIGAGVVALYKMQKDDFKPVGLESWEAV